MLDPDRKSRSEMQRGSPFPPPLTFLPPLSISIHVSFSSCPVLSCGAAATVLLLSTMEEGERAETQRRIRLHAFQPPWLHGTSLCC